MTARRIYCRGGCAAWWYYDGARKEGKQRGGGRPREWCPRCYPVHLAAMRVCQVCGHPRGDIKGHPCANTAQPKPSPIATDNRESKAS